MPSKMRKDIYILVKDRTFIRSASFPRVMTHFYFSLPREKFLLAQGKISPCPAVNFSLPRESIFMISFYSSFFISFLYSFYSSDFFIIFLHRITPRNPMKKNNEEKRGCVTDL